MMCEPTKCQEKLGGPMDPAQLRAWLREEAAVSQALVRQLAVGKPREVAYE